MKVSNIIIFDEEDGQRVGFQLKAFLQEVNNYQVKLISEEACLRHDLTAKSPQLVILVLPLERGRAEELLANLRSRQAYISLLPVVRTETLSSGLDNRLLSANDFLVTPLQKAEVRFRVRRLTVNQQPEIIEEGTVEAGPLDQLIGTDPVFFALKRKIQLAARSESTVLLTGETGTGKERCARALHYLSARSGKPFLPVNCGAIPADLFENELFGHEKGAFTGAFVAHSGLIAEAKDGTLFLDEIEGLSLTCQVKFLRFLQDQTYYPIGSARMRQANVWIIASTNLDLPTKIREGAFREDLFYRLAVISLQIPPLRQRKTDIPLLACYFWKLYGAKAGRSDQELPSSVIKALSQHSWPGNVRELENVIQRIAVLSESEIIQPEELSIPRLQVGRQARGNSFAQRKALLIEEFERQYITELLQTHQGNVTRAAQEAKKDRRAFGRLIKKYQISKV